MSKTKASFLIAVGTGLISLIFAIILMGLGPEHEYARLTFKIWAVFIGHSVFWCLLGFLFWWRNS